MDVQHNLDNNKYDNPFSYPIKHQYPSTEKYREAVRKHRALNLELREQFKRDAIEELGLSNHPRAQQLWNLCWDEGHGEGLWRVWDLLQQWSELLK